MSTSRYLRGADGLVSRTFARLTAGVVLSVLACSCKPAPVETEREILNNPEILLDERIPIAELKLGGIMLGAAEKDVSPVTKVNEVTSQGYRWLYCSNGSAFKVVGGRVVTLQLNDAAALAKLGLGSEDDMKEKLGQPDSMPAPRMYRYNARHITLSWGAEGLHLINVFE